jgi:hypothetical protein
MALNKEYYSFEASYTADVSDLDNKDIDDYSASLYERLNAIIDDQAEETVKSLTPQDED